MSKDINSVRKFIRNLDRGTRKGIFLFYNLSVKKLAVFVATGFEDTELISALDVFNRNELGYSLFSVENKNEVKGKFEAIVRTKTMDQFNPNEFDGIFLPGGPGVDLLLESLKLRDIINVFNIERKILAAICAAPEVLVRAGAINDQRITSYPGFATVANNTGSKVEVDGHIITGRDFRTTIIFAEEVVKQVKIREENEV